MSTPINDHVVLVTASSAGLGAAVAKSFARRGARVVINYCNSREKADALVEELYARYSTPGAHAAHSTGNSQYVAIQADLNIRSDIKQLIEQTVQLMGRLDILISNHGWTTFTNFMNIDENLNEADWDRCFNMNIKSHLFLFHAAKEHLEASEGSFITISSISGIKPGGSCLVRIFPCTLSQFHTLNGSTGLLCDQGSSDTPGQITGIDRRAENSCQHGST